MSGRGSVVVAVAATAVVVAGFCAWFLRARSDFERLDRFPFALANACAAGDFAVVEEHLAPGFTWRDGARSLDRAETLATLRALVASRKFAPAVARVSAVRADETRSRLVVYGVVIEGDPDAERSPPSRAHRIEMLVEDAGDGFMVLEASR